MRGRSRVRTRNALLSPRSVIQRCVVPSISQVLETELEQSEYVCVCVCVLAHICAIVCQRCPCDPSLDTHAHARRRTHAARLPLLARARIGTAVLSVWSREPETRTQHTTNS